MEKTICFVLLAAGLLLLFSSAVAWKIVRSPQTWAALVAMIGVPAGAIALAPVIGSDMAWAVGLFGAIVSAVFAVHSEWEARSRQGDADGGGDSNGTALNVDVMAPSNEMASTRVDGVVPKTELEPVSAAPELDDQVATRTDPVDRSSTSFFSDRFARAFPGVRGIEVFKSPEAVKRLSLLLKRPLSFQMGNVTYDPIWYWERGNLQIESFCVVRDDFVLLDMNELIVDKVAAVNMGGYYHKFVYVQTRSAPPAGVYEYPADELKHPKRSISEEVGLYNGRYITREEYDDGAAVIDGEVVDVSESVELRVRYLTPHNFLIAAHNSPINLHLADRELPKILDGILNNEVTLEDLADFVCRLTKKPPMHFEYGEL